MSGKSVCLTSVMMALLSLGVVQGQDYSRLGSSIVPGSPGSSLGPATGVNASEAGPPLIGEPIITHSSISSWLVYPRSPGCACQAGGDGPISGEVYAQTGFSFPISGNYFGRVFGVGWDVEGGGRLHLFNPEMDADWLIGLSVSNVYNDAVERSIPRTLISVVNRFTGILTPSVTVTMRDYNRTYVGAYVGREWYLCGAAESDGVTPTWKWGINGGGRYGTDKLEVGEIQHLTKRIEALFGAIHTEVEVPYGPAILSFGLWGEYAYTWSDILQPQNNSDLMELNLMLTAGVRF
jgi:hypothetical protein